MSTHNEVAHAWAHQTGRHRKGFNMFYEGDTIYSYGHHFPIARLVQTDEGTVVLFTTRTYSVSTSKHKTYTARAVAHLKTFRVEGVTENWWGIHNVQDYLRRIQDILQKAKRARVYGDWHMREAMSLIQEAQDYIRLFKVEGFESFNWDPDAIVEGVREAARIHAEKQSEQERIRKEEARRNFRENIWPNMKRWLRGATGTQLRIHTSRPLPRIVDDRVETTWGATVPLEMAKRMYWIAIRCRREHQEYVPKTSIRVGDFHLTRIKANGDLVVGCHDIPFWFMRYAACLKGIPDAQPQA
ncbi:hypothetical protein LZK73_21955 [Neorhizobium galegae]|nr:hypothetical protein LZK73_21955 [Neorhizobium galegae]